MTQPDYPDFDDPQLPKAFEKRAFQSGAYPYADTLGKKDYERELERLQLQLVRLQSHLIATKGRVVLVFEGRDGAGKSSAIGAYREHVNPRNHIIAALPKPSDRELTQWYFQRYVDWLPAGGETVLFDRSWYNRAGVEPVMGYCTPAQTEAFLDAVPHFEQMLVRDGIHLCKFWLSISRETQFIQFHERRHDPLKQWKVSPVDVAALDKWDDYTAARDRMLAASDIAAAPWTAVLSNDKKRARLEVIRSVLDGIDYEGKDREAIGRIDRKLMLTGAELRALPGAG